MGANVVESQSRPPRSGKRLSWWHFCAVGAVLLCLALVLGRPLLDRVILAYALEEAQTYLNGTLHASRLELDILDGRCRVYQLACTDTQAKQVLEIDCLTVEMESWLEQRVGAITLEGPVLHIDASTGGSDLLLLKKERGSSGEFAYPRRLTISDGELLIQGDTWVRSLGIGAEAELREGKYNVTLAVSDTDGMAEFSGSYNTITGTVDASRLWGEYHSPNGAVTGDLAFSYAPAVGLEISEGYFGDGTDTIAIQGNWYGDSAVITVRAADFDFGARHRALAGLRGDSLAVRCAGWLDLVTVQAAYHRDAAWLTGSAVIHPQQLTAQVIEAAGVWPALGRFAGSGWVRYDTGTTTLNADTLDVELPDLGARLENGQLSYQPARRGFVMNAAGVTYGKYGARELAVTGQLGDEITITDGRFRTAGGRVAVTGTVALDGAAARLRGTVAGLELAEIDRLFSDELAALDIKLREGHIDSYFTCNWDGPASWSLAAEPVIEKGKVYHRAAGNLSNLTVTAPLHARPGSFTVRGGTVMMPAGTIEYNLDLGGENFTELQRLEVSSSSLDVAQLRSPLSRVCRDNCRINRVSGLVSGEVLATTDANGKTRFSGEVNLADVSVMMREPNISALRITGDMVIDTAGVLLPAMRGYQLAEFETGWPALILPSAPNLTVARIELGGIVMEEFAMVVTMAGPRLQVEGATWKMLGGTCRAAAQINFAENRYAAATLIRGLSLHQTCAAFPEINNYLSGTVDAALWVKGEQFNLTAAQGLISAFAYDTEDEPKRIHRDMLLRLGGAEVRSLLVGRDTFKLEAAELTILIDRGKMIFEEMNMPVFISLIPLRKLRVQVDDENRQIGVLHFFKTIELVPSQGLEVEYAW